MNHLLTINNINYFENDYCKMEIKEDVLYCMFIPFLEITEEVAKVIISDRIKFTNGKVYPFFADISNLKYITREAREYFASENGIKNLSAAAYFATTHNEKFLWEMFLQINRPALSSKIFSDKKEALKWLGQFK
ncbi:MAG: hypothetical protein K2X86_02740 [Cytophagaceae bacterium]|nr:hypothetical protein [Cytophagaceae bacterium]